MGLITSGDMPLNIRDHSYLLGETAMTVWFAKYDVSMDRLEEGMALVRGNTAEFMGQISQYEMAPSTVSPIEKGVTYADRPDYGFYFDIGVQRDFDAIVEATSRIVQVVAIADQEYAPIEESVKQSSNYFGTDQGPQRE